jgi:5-oxoprolinase (ATP-hydrolysing)
MTYEIYVDTGGTFTDCLGKDPEGKWIRRKVLSNGSLRGMVESWIDRKTLVIRENWDLEQDIIRGYQFQLLKHKHEISFIQCFDLEQNILRLTKEVPRSLCRQNMSFEISSTEEAPVLGARLITNTPLDLDLPRLHMKLGSTRGTNALLERKGADMVLFVTRGFKDILEIGNQQRPDIFALEVIKREMLYRQVVEIEERIDAKGNVIIPLNIKDLEKKLIKAKRKGFSSAAICLLNSYINPVHEFELAGLLRRRGVSDISISTDLSPLIKYVNRTETATVNAYLNPVFRNYLDSVKESISNGRVHVMTSSGGLVREEHFSAKDSLLSGPAGGVVGAVSIGKRNGMDHIISFDMGGTSTDVSRYDGEFDYRYDLEVGGAHIFSPALSIETVAAGGGSLCYYDGFKLSVGPESAGANPGPACYGAGGPITITDVNLLLGKLDPAAFGIPVFREEASQKLDKLISEIFKSSGKQYAREEILTGFHDIANEVMAGAIRKISIARGYDPADYVLMAFGGAGGMHACKIASLLGMQTVVVPADAGLLSAYGLANAVIERFAEKLVLRPYEEIKSDLGIWIAELSSQAMSDVRKEGVSREISVRVKTVFLRFMGQDESLPVPWQEGDDLMPLFREQYSRVYGHWTENREVEVESIRVAASEQSAEDEQIGLPDKTYHPEPVKTISSYCDGTWCNIPVFNREDLDAGAKVSGDALLIDQYSTTVIEKGWEMVINNYGAAIIKDKSQGQAGKREEAIIRETQLELFTNRFKFIAENMGAMLQRTSLSVNIKERLDFSCALVSPDGYLVANAPHIPVHLGSLGVCVRSLMEKIDMGPGDTIITNHPAYGGSHLPDVTLVTPVFTNGEELLGYVVNRAHHAELGGSSPASMPPDATSLEEEGVIIEPFRLVSKGRVNWKGMREILGSGPWPSRAVEENIADLNAALAANLAGAGGLRELAVKHGPGQVIDYMQYLRDYAASRMRLFLGKIPDGRYEAQEKLDDNSILKAAIEISKDTCCIDFTGTSGVHQGNMNATYAIVNSVVIYVLRLLLNEPLPLNEGILEPVGVVLPECLLNPDFNRSHQECPAIVGGNVEVSQRLTDTLLKAFGVVACSKGTMNNLMMGNDSYSYYETICGGCGAGPGFIGASGVHHHMTNTRITDPEILEHRYPLRLVEFSIRKKSGGRGAYRGGNGVVRILEFTSASTVSVLSQHRVIRPYGMQGGKQGKRGRQYIIRADGVTEKLKGIDGFMALPGDRLVVKTPGGGGWGK